MEETNETEGIILSLTGARGLRKLEKIQELWSGYGAIIRYALDGAEKKQVVVKQVRLPEGGNHPRGWNTALSHKRKLRSYEVEREWYRNWASCCGSACRVPACLGMVVQGEESVMVMEDLNEAGFTEGKTSVTLEEVDSCLEWLATFHATFLGESPRGLWPVGTYWHLETRPDELESLDDLGLKKAASLIDQKLSRARFLTFVHGDAKLANFCFSEHSTKVAAVDFQYVGGGCGMKDVAYFLGSCLYEQECQRMETRLLDLYFEKLIKALDNLSKKIDFEALEKEWRELYPLAWTDFHRFIKGWSPGHWKINSYSEKLTREVLAQLEEEGLL